MLIDVSKMEDLKRTFCVVMVNFIMFQTVMLFGKQDYMSVFHSFYNTHTQNKDQSQKGYRQGNDSFSDQNLDSLDSPWKYFGYFDFYWAKDGNNNLQNREYGNLVSYSKLGEIQSNLAMVKLSYQTTDIRSNMALGIGTYMIKNLANEPLGLRNVYEANFGIKLHRQKSIWMDVGVFPSHIGFESAIGYECLNLTRSLLAENSPYYEAGCRLVGGNNSISWGLYLLNGWQAIYKNPNASKGLNLGGQLNKKWRNMEFNYSNIVVGTMRDLNGIRYFHDLYWKWELKNNWNLIAGVDFGIQRNSLQEKHVWQTPILIVSKQWNKHRIAFRAEQYKDLMGVVINNAYNNKAGVNIFGLSTNYDCHVKNNVWIRIEYRNLMNQGLYFPSEANTDPTKMVTMITIALQAKI